MNSSIFQGCMPALLTPSKAEHGFVICGAVGATTGISDALPREILHLVSLCQRLQLDESDALSASRETVMKAPDVGFKAWLASSLGKDDVSW